MAIQRERASPMQIAHILEGSLPKDVRTLEGPERLKRRPGGLKTRYRLVLLGYEQYSWPEAELEKRFAAFEQALKDVQACLRCKCNDVREYVLSRGGKDRVGYMPRSCEASGPGKYLALSHRNSVEYDRPMFAMHECRGSARRVRDLSRAMQSKHHTEGEG